LFVIGDRALFIKDILLVKSKKYVPIYMNNGWKF
jgi:hypothetical protein